MTEFWRPRCECGRFCGYEADCAVYYGGPTDLEPPDPIYFCARCVEEAKTQVLTEGYLPDCYYIKPDWWYQAIKDHSLVQAGPRGADWSRWYVPDRVPDGYVVRIVGERRG